MITNSALIFQQKELSTAAWVALILIVLFILILNFSLISALRKKDNSDLNVLNRLMMSIREPEHRDDEMRQELNDRIERLKKNDPPSKETS